MGALSPTRGPARYASSSHAMRARSVADPTAGASTRESRGSGSPSPDAARKASRRLHAVGARRVSRPGAALRAGHSEPRRAPGRARQRRVPARRGARWLELPAALSPAEGK